MSSLKSFLKFLLVLLAIASAIAVVYDFWKQNSKVNPLDKVDDKIYDQAVIPKIQVHTPLANSAIKSPVVVEGFAHKLWFEGEGMSARIITGVSNSLSAKVHIEEVDSDSDMVPFSLTIEFNKPSKTYGYIMFERGKGFNDGFPYEYRHPILFE